LKIFAQNFTENEVKAAYIKNICQFVTWPENRIVTENFTIVIFGKADINSAIENFFSKISLNGKPTKIKTITKIDEIIDCDILFINATSNERLAKLLDKAKVKKSLIISDTKGYADYGCHINFYLKNQKVKFEINLNKAVEDGFYIQSLLLDYAKIIKPKNEK